METLLKKILLSSSLVALFIFVCTFQADCQGNIRDSSLNIVQLTFDYGLHIPGGDMAKRFGFANSIGFNPAIKTKGNWIFGGDFDFYFGNQIKEDSILDGLKTSAGTIIGKDGLPAEAFLYERGFNLYLHAGRLLPILAPNPNSGFFYKIGVGYFQHKIRIEDRDNAIPQVKGDYKKQYDRLTSGIGITEMIGYQFLSNRKLLNFYCGLEFTQATTKGRRDYQIDLMAPYTDNFTDLQYGIKIGWIFPIYKRSADAFYYF